MFTVFKKLAWLLVAGSIIVAVVRTVPWEDPAAVWAWLDAQGQAMKAFIQSLTSKIDIGSLPDPDPIVPSDVLPADSSADR